ncbi:MAG: MFS transporter [Erysipelotrichaceae bacterium]|nr:MFS transporter [Erysipelotrichaceae bacterium]
MKKVSCIRMIFLIGLYSLVANFVHPISPTLYKLLNFPDYMFGVAFAAMALTNFAFSPFWGNLFNRYGCAKLTAVAFFGYAFSQYLFSVATTELSLTFARFVAGIFISGISCSQIIYQMKNAPEDKKGQYMMYNATTVAVISPMGYLIGGFLGDYSLKLCMNAQVIGLAIIGILFLLILDDPETQSNPITIKEFLSQSNPLRGFIDARKYLTPTLVSFFIIGMCAKFASTCYDQAFNYFIRDQFGFPSSYNGMIKAGVGVVAFVSNLTVCNYLLRNTKVERSVIYILGCLMTLSVGFVFIQDKIPFIALNVVFFGCNSVYIPLLQRILTKVSTPETNGMFVGVYNSMDAIGMVCGSLIAGFVYNVNPRLAFVVTAVFFAASVISAMIHYNKLQKA